MRHTRLCPMLTRPCLPFLLSAVQFRSHLPGGLQDLSIHPRVGSVPPQSYVDPGGGSSERGVHECVRACRSSLRPAELSVHQRVQRAAQGVRVRARMSRRRRRIRRAQLRRQQEQTGPVRILPHDGGYIHVRRKALVRVETLRMHRQRVARRRQTAGRLLCALAMPHPHASQAHILFETHFFVLKIQYKSTAPFNHHHDQSRSDRAMIMNRPARAAIAAGVGLDGQARCGDSRSFSRMRNRILCVRSTVARYEEACR